jgi:serine beta-lactamase-like protein LACTB
MKNKKGKIVNAPYVDNSYKWAGGGLLSNIGDLLKFGNIMLYSYQWKPDGKSSERSVGTDMSSRRSNFDASRVKDAANSESLPGYLRRKTVLEVWKPNENAKCTWDSNGYFGLGWAVVPYKKIHGRGREQRFYASHTGGAVGASSALVILPHHGEHLDDVKVPPSGVVVGIFANLTSVGLAKVAMEIATIFEEVEK